MRIRGTSTITSHSNVGKEDGDRESNAANDGYGFVAIARSLPTRMWQRRRRSGEKRHQRRKRIRATSAITSHSNVGKEDGDRRTYSNDGSANTARVRALPTRVSASKVEIGRCSRRRCVVAATGAPIGGYLEWRKSNYAERRVR